MHRLSLIRLGGPSVIRAGHLCQCLIAATQDDTPDATNCLKVITIVKAEFRDRTLSKEKTWQTVVLITKGESRDFRGLILMEVLWNTDISILTC